MFIKSLAYKNLLLTVGVILFSGSVLFGQIEVSTPDSPTVKAYKQLVKKTLIGNGVLTGHFKVTAPMGSVGLFSFNTEKDLVKEGLILSTGNVNDIVGPNDTTNTSTEFFGKGDEDLSKLIGRLTADAVSIEFDFIPYSDSVGFYYFFASEEYPEYVGKGFNDAFAFLIQGPGFPYYTNIARLQIEPKSIPITIDNINFVVNSDHFISNHLDEDRKLLKPKSWQKILDEPEMLQEMEFDGMTVKLRATAKVIPGEIYRLKIVIADVGDLKYDSGVFLEKESFGSPMQGVAGIDTVVLLQKFVSHYKEEPEKLNSFIAAHPAAVEIPEPDYVDSLSLKLFYESDSSSVVPNRKKLKKALSQLSEGQKYKVVIVGHTDSTGGYQYNVDLSKRRASSTAYWLHKHNIEAKEIEWVADKKPATSNTKPEGRQQNRRVEILFIRKQ